MSTPSRRAMLAAFAAALPVVAAAVVPVQLHAQPAANPLASWNDSPRKQAILAFVRATTDKTASTFVREQIGGAYVGGACTSARMR